MSFRCPKCSEILSFHKGDKTCECVCGWSIKSHLDPLLEILEKEDYLGACAWISEPKNIQPIERVSPRVDKYAWEPENRCLVVAICVALLPATILGYIYPNLFFASEFLRYRNYFGALLDTIVHYGMVGLFAAIAYIIGWITTERGMFLDHEKRGLKLRYAFSVIAFVVAASIVFYWRLVE